MILQYQDVHVSASFERQPLQANPVNHPAQQSRKASKPFQQFRRAPQPDQKFRQAQPLQNISNYSHQPTKQPLFINCNPSLVGSSQQKTTIHASTQNLKVVEPPTSQKAYKKQQQNTELNIKDSKEALKQDQLVLLSKC